MGAIFHRGQQFAGLNLPNEWGKITGTLANQADLKTALDKKYDTDDAAETALADDDYIPFYDTSATGKRKVLWSRIKAVLEGVFTLIRVIATNETGTTASKAYKKGEKFYKAGYFCYAMTDIASGATLTRNTNYARKDIASSMLGFMWINDEEGVNLNNRRLGVSRYTGSETNAPDNFHGIVFTFFINMVSNPTHAANEEGYAVQFSFSFGVNRPPKIRVKDNGTWGTWVNFTLS